MLLVRATADFLSRGGVRGPTWRQLPALSPALTILLSSGLYGAVMASYGGLVDERLWMAVYGALKIPLLFVATMLLAVPAFYVANLLAGVGEHFRRAWHALVDYQLAVSLQLGALVPVTLFMNLTNADYRAVQAWSTLMFAGAAWNAQRALGRAYEELGALDPVHHQLRRLWLGLYAFVGVQMAWDLRPFVGNPEMPVQFFRDDIGNAYLEVGRVLFEAAFG